MITLTKLISLAHLKLVNVTWGSGQTVQCLPVSVEPGSSINEALATEEFTFEDYAWINT